MSQWNLIYQDISVFVGRFPYLPSPAGMETRPTGLFIATLRCSTKHIFKFVFDLSSVHNLISIPKEKST